MIESSAWNDIPLSPAVATKEQRLSAALNVLNNGGQTLTVLLMPPIRDHWTSYSQINGRLFQRAGLILDLGTTKGHLLQTIEPIGAAARSTIDDKDWSLTPFGIALRPALIFAWQRLLRQGLDGIEVFGSTSTRPRSHTGDLATRAPYNTARLLLGLRDAGVTYSENLHRIVGLPAAGINRHVKRLAGAGLVTKKLGLNTGKGEEIKYETASGDPLEWPGYRHPKGGRRIKGSEMLKRAIKKLSAEGETITQMSVKKILFNDYGVGEVNADFEASFGLRFYTKQGLLVKNMGRLTEIQLTDSGLAVVTDILEPLQRWSSDRWSVEEINRIGARFTSHPYEYDPFFRSIAASYREHSPFLNSDSEAKLDLVLRMIREHPGITQVDIYKQTDMSYRSATLLVRYLARSGFIVKTKADKGNRVFLYPAEMST